MIFFEAISIGEAINRLMRGDVPMLFSAYDGSSAGPLDSVVGFHLRNERGLAYMVTAPGELGMARAYLSGDLDLSGVHPGDPTAVLEIFKQETKSRMPTPGDILTIMRALNAHHLLPPTPPAQERVPRWRRAAEGVRRRACGGDYFFAASNDFYRVLLGDVMTQSCAELVTSDQDLTEGQLAQFDRVCRELRLAPGQRLLDIGCGWGEFVRFAAREYGVRALGVTRSLDQALWAKEAIDHAGLADLAEVRHLDYRDVAEGDFDAVSVLGLRESVAAHNHSGYFQRVADRLRPGGRLLGHYLAAATPAHRRPGPFTDRYVLSGAEFCTPTELVRTARAARLEVASCVDISSQYAATMGRWSENLVENWDECVAEVGEGSAKVWGLYLAGARIDAQTRGTLLQQLSAQRA